MKGRPRMILVVFFTAVVACLGREVPDNMGKEFILGFMEASRHDNGASRKELMLFITTSSVDPVNVFISVPLMNQHYTGKNITVEKGVVREVSLPASLRVLGTVRSNNGLYITSSDEIVVFGINAADKSTDGFLGIPADVLGTQYYVPSFYSTSESFLKSAIVIVGTNDGAKLNIKIKSTHDGNIRLEGKDYRNGDWLNTSINRYEVIQIQCRGDLTGTFVQSSHKISVFGGSTVTNIGKGHSKDHIEEQIPPVNVWGKRFAMRPVPDTNPNLIRILASEDNTEVSIKNKGTRYLQSGRFCEIYGDSAYFISSNKPVLTVQYVPSASDGHTGDPAMALVTPIEQCNVFYSLLTPKSSTGEDFDNTFIFVMEGLSYKELVLDEKPIPEGSLFSVTQINNISTGYIKIPHGSHTLRHSSGSLPFGGFLYGGASKESYAFPVGQRFTPINQECQPQPMEVGDGLDNDCDGRVDEEICNDNKDNDVDGRKDEDCVLELTSTSSTARPTTPTTLTTRTTTTKQPTTKNTTTMATSKSTTTFTSSTARPATPTTLSTRTTTTKQPTTNTRPTSPTTPTTLTTRTTTSKQPTTKSTTKIATTKLTTTSTGSTARPTTSTTITTRSTTSKQPTTKRGISMDQIKPQWFTLTEIGITSGVAIVVLGAIGVCCKKCWGLLKDRDDDDDEDDKRYRRKRRSTVKLPLGGPSIRPMYM